MCLVGSCVRFFVIDGLRALFLPVHVMVSAHWFLLLEFLCGAHMVRAAGETVYVLLVYICSAALIAAPLLAALGGPAHVIFCEVFAPCCFQDIGAAMRAAAFAARPGLGVAAAAWCSIPGLCSLRLRYVECWVFFLERPLCFAVLRTAVPGKTDSKLS